MSRYAVSALVLVLASDFIGSAALANTVTFVCDYKTYSDPKGTRKVEESFRLTFLIDSKADKAYMIGNNGSSELALVPNADGFTLVEITGTGNVMVTAITFKGESVHSRSGIMMGGIIPSQYYGGCMQK